MAIDKSGNQQVNFWVNPRMHIWGTDPRSNNRLQNMTQSETTSVSVGPEQHPTTTNGTNTIRELQSQDTPQKSVSAAIQSITEQTSPNKTETTTDTKTSDTNSTVEKPISESPETPHIATPEDVEKLKDMLGNKQEQTEHIADKTHIKQIQDMFGGSDSVNAAGKSTITKSTTSGHPHLDETTNNAVKSHFNSDTKEVDPKAANTLLATFKEKGFADANGTINFKALGLDPKTIQKAGIKGKVFVKEDGSFDFKITGKCSQEAVQCMAKLKEKLKEINKEQNLNVPINIHPETVGPLSAEDKMILERGGQIQYRPVDNEKIMKLTLDPGSNGQDDGLMIGVFTVSQDNSLINQSLSPKIPLKVVFEGGELNGQKVGPFLPNWRSEKLFENSVIHSEGELFLGKRKTNEDDVGRIQTQNKLWNAVNEYLKASATITEGHFETSNDNNIQPEVAQEVDSPTAKADEKNLQSYGEIINTNQDNIPELSPNISTNFDSSIEEASLGNATNESTIKNENGEQIARKNLLVGENIKIRANINKKTSLDQTKSRITTKEQKTKKHKKNMLDVAQKIADEIQGMSNVVATTNYDTFLMYLKSQTDNFKNKLSENEKQAVKPIDEFTNAIQDFKDKHEQLLTSTALEAYSAALQPLINNELTMQAKITEVTNILKPATQDLLLAANILKTSQIPEPKNIESIAKEGQFMSKAAIGFILLKKEKKDDQKNISYDEAIQRFNDL